MTGTRCYSCERPATARTKVCACGSRAFITGARPVWPPAWVTPTVSEFEVRDPETLASLAFVLGPIPHHEPDLLEGYSEKRLESTFRGRRRSRRVAAA